jgi:hypothetical protein
MQKHIKMRLLNCNELKQNTGFLRIILSLFLVFVLTNEGIKAQEDLYVINQPNNKWLNFTDATNSLYHYLAGQSYDLLQNRAKKIADIRILTGWQERQEWIKRSLNDIVGPFPEKTELNAKILRTIEKGTYRVEHIVYESQPGFYVTSSMFIPAGIKRKKAPVIIHCSGHSAEGYRYKNYQHDILNLVKKGFIVFAFDPVGQGERIEYYDPATGNSTIGGPTAEHSYPGAQAFITGSSQAKYMIWDGIRAVDYLLTRKEVDPLRIGITGRSGGGTQSAYIAAFDERIAAAAPECYITSFTRLLQSIGPQDAEQNFYHAIAKGIDHADLLLVRAPKPAMMITTTRDFFSIQGARETAEEVSGIYQAYGKKDNFGMVEDDAPHASTKKNREAMYTFFQKHLNNPGDPVDQDVEVLSNDEIRVTNTGQVSTAYKGETVFSLNKKEAEKLIENLQSSRNDLSGHLNKVVNSAKILTGYQEPAEVDQPVFTGRIQREGYAVEKYFLKGEGNYVIPYLLMIPHQPNNKALIYLHPSDKSAEAVAGGEIEWFVMQGFTVLVPDLIGIGEMGPGSFQGDAFIGGSSYNLWFASMLIGRSIAGIRAGDVIRLARLLVKNSAINEIYGMARQEMSPVLLHAAAFDQVITRIALVEPLISYQSIVMNRFYDPKFIHNSIPGCLKAYDLPDLAASLAPRKLMMVDITDNMGEKLALENAADDLLIIRAAYHAGNADEQLSIIFQKSAESLKDHYRTWIK